MASKPLTNQQTAELCRSLYGLLHAGISAGDACHLLASEESGSLHALLAQLGNYVDTGVPLGDALLLCECMNAGTTGLIRTGEYTGRLEEALLASAQYHETRDRTLRQLRSALGYPAMLLVLMLCVIGVLLIQVLPVFAAVYASLGTSMTGIAAGLLWFGHFLKDMLPVLFILLLLPAGILFLCWIHAPLKEKLSYAAKNILEHSKLVREFQNSRFLQALSMGIHGGLLPEDAVSLAASIMKDSPGAAGRCQNCINLIQQGTSLPEALFSAELIDAYGCRMLSLGIKTGHSDRITEDLAGRMQEQAENHLQDFISKVEPAMVLVASLLVGLILLSVMLPLMQVLSALG